MCDHCGCSEEGSGYSLINPAKSNNQPSTPQNHSHHNLIHSHHDHPHPHDHEHPHNHPHNHNHHDHNHDYLPYNRSAQPDRKQRIIVETDILSKNNLLAQRNKGYFEEKEIHALNLVSSPGAGKTTLLERSITLLGNTNVYVIEGDQQTALDAERIHQTGVPVIQVNTGNGCHLDADMVYNAVKELIPVNKSVLFIENVGNLVCPALFDLGEHFRIVITSITEGEDKPLKYPNMFATSQLCLINKTDLIPYVNFSIEKFKVYALQVNPHLQFIELSALTGEGFETWLNWLKTRIKS